MIWMTRKCWRLWPPWNREGNCNGTYDHFCASDPLGSHGLQISSPVHCRRIPLDSLAFDIDGVVADIMTTFLSLVRERYDCGHHLRYEHITEFSLEDCLDLEPRIIAELIRELIDRPHQLAVEPFPQAVAGPHPPGPGDAPVVRDRPGPGRAHPDLAAAHLASGAAPGYPGDGHR